MFNVYYLCKIEKIGKKRPSLHFYAMVFWWKKGSLHRNGRTAIPKITGKEEVEFLHVSCNRAIIFLVIATVFTRYESIFLDILIKPVSSPTFVQQLRSSPD